MKNAVIAACLSMCPLVAVACPVADDLEDGIVIVSGKPVAPVTRIVRRVSGDLVWHSQESAMFPDPWSTYTHGGLFDLFTHRESGSGQKVTRYDRPLPPMDRIVPGAVFTSQSTWGDPEGRQQWTGALAYEILENAPIQIGACPYGTVRVNVDGVLTYPDGTSRSYGRSLVLIPELAYQIGYSEPLSVEKAGWFTPVKKDKAMMQQASTMPDIAVLFDRYGAGG